MSFQVSELQQHVQNWLNICRESMHNTNQPQLKNLLHIEVVALENLLHGLTIKRLVLVDKTESQINVLRGVYEKKTKFGAPSECEMNEALNKIDAQINRDVVSRCADDVFHSPFKHLIDEKKTVRTGALRTQFKGFPVTETEGLKPVSDVMLAKVTYANGELKREVIETKNSNPLYNGQELPPMFDPNGGMVEPKSPEELNRERLSQVTKLSPIQVRLIMSQMPDASTHDIVYMCLKRYGESLAGKGASVDEASTYYADYHIDRVMKELGE